MYGVRQSMNSDGGRCHDNAQCESMWARLKEELIYGRIRTENYTIEELKQMVWSTAVPQLFRTAQAEALQWVPSSWARDNRREFHLRTN